MIAVIAFFEVEQKSIGDAIESDLHEIIPVKARHFVFQSQKMANFVRGYGKLNWPC